MGGGFLAPDRLKVGAVQIGNGFRRQASQTAAYSSGDIEIPLEREAVRLPEPDELFLVRDRFTVCGCHAPGECIWTPIGEL